MSHECMTLRGCDRHSRHLGMRRCDDHRAERYRDTPENPTAQVLRSIETLFIFTIASDSTWMCEWQPSAGHMRSSVWSYTRKYKELLFHKSIKGVGPLHYDDSPALFPWCTLTLDGMRSRSTRRCLLSRWGDKALLSRVGSVEPCETACARARDGFTTTGPGDDDLHAKNSIISHAFRSEHKGLFNN